MIVAVDTSSLVAYLGGATGDDVVLVDEYLAWGVVVLPPVVVVEILSDPRLPAPLVRFINSLPVLDVHKGYWERAARLRAKVISKSLKSRLGDVLIAQSCIDHKARLLSRDKDFRHYAKYGSLVLNH